MNRKPEFAAFRISFPSYRSRALLHRAVAVPLTANSGISMLSFLGYDLLGSAMYVGAVLGIGRLIGDRIDNLCMLTSSLKSVSAGFAIVGALAIVGWRYKFRREVGDGAHPGRRTGRID